MYKPGLHILATLETTRLDLLETHENFGQKIETLIQTFQLENLGEVFYNFSPKGFTAVICLSESHISIHTWPEYHRLNLDIYLSNYLKVNNGVVEDIFNELVQFFEAHIVDLKKIER